MRRKCKIQEQRISICEIIWYSAKEYLPSPSYTDAQCFLVVVEGKKKRLQLGQGWTKGHVSKMEQEAITWICGRREEHCERCGEEQRGGLIVRKMNGERGTGDTLGQTLMDSVPVGNDGNTGSDLGFAATGNSVITHTHTHVQTYTHKLLPICLLLCLALTQYYQSHHSSCVILLRDTNWTLSLHDCQGTWVIFYPSSHQRASGGENNRGNEEEEEETEPICSLLTFRICPFNFQKQSYCRSLPSCTPSL